MKVFICWSGERSRIVAQALRAYLPKMLQATEPFMSDQDMRSGARWPVEIAKQLQETHVGIICLTRSNLNDPWILFESGALSKNLTESLPCTLLIGMKPTDIKPPLSLFHGSEATKAGLTRVIKSINATLPKDKDRPPLDDIAVEEIVETWWSRIEPEISNALAMPDDELGLQQERRTSEDMIREILEHVRFLAQTKPLAYTADPWVNSHLIYPSLGAQVAWAQYGKKAKDAPPEDQDA